MFWGRRAREFNLQVELDGYAADIEELIEIAETNADRAFEECHRNEWDYWRRLARDILPKLRGILDHARGASEYWVRAIRLNMASVKKPRPYGKYISRDENGQVRIDPHNVKHPAWKHDEWYVPDDEPEPQPAPAPARPFRVQILVASEWVDVQSFDSREAAEAFADGISDSTTRIAP